METGEARTDEFCSCVRGGGVKDGAGVSAAATGEIGRLTSAAQGSGNGEGDPGFSGAGISGEDGKSASGEAVFPKPVDGLGFDVCEADQVSLAGGGGWGWIAYGGFRRIPGERLLRLWDGCRGGR
jgi:hypothetical protein